MAVIRPLTIAPQQYVCDVAPRIGFEGAGQVFLEGSLLLISSNQIVIATTTPVTLLMGLAAANASGVTAAPIPYYPLLPGLVLEGTLYDSTPADVTLAKTHFFATVGLTLASGKWYVDPHVTACAKIIGFKDHSGIGSIDQRVFFVLDADAINYAT